MLAEDSARTPSIAPTVAAVWFLLVGPGAVLYAAWVLVVDRHYFPRLYVLPLVIAYLAYAVWTYRLGRERFTFRWTRAGWARRIAAICAVAGAFLVVYAPAVLLAYALAAGVDVVWSRLRPAGPSLRLYAAGTLVAFAVLFPAANRMYLLHGVFYTFFAPEPPRLMENALFDVNELGMRGPPMRWTEGEPACTVLLVGDSVTWGFPYPWEDTFARHLGDLFSAKGRAVRVLNAAIPSQSIVQIDARVGELRAYAPDVAVLMVGYQWMRSVEHRERLDSRSLGRWRPEVEWVFVPPIVPELVQLGPRNTLRGLTGTRRRWSDPDANFGEFRFRLERTVTLLKRGGVDVVLASHPALSIDERVRERVRYEAARSHVAYVDVAASFSEESQYAFGDGIHPDRKGQVLVAELLAGPVTRILRDRAEPKGLSSRTACW